MRTPTRKVGFIVNPIAGIGGTVGLKGSDGVELQQRARQLGGEPRSAPRARLALEHLSKIRDSIELFAAPAEMGADIATRCGFKPQLVGNINSPSSSRDTQNVARLLLEMKADLLLFVGGDGTARDIYEAVGLDLVVLGVPAGVKIQSAAFATSAAAAGELARLYLSEKVSSVQEREVMDIDEAALRRGKVSSRLYGYLRVPFQIRIRRVQGMKSPTPASEASAAASIAIAVIDEMQDDCVYILGPGTTTRAITERLGLAKTLIGVDVIVNKKLLISDATESQLLAAIKGKPAKIVVTPIGGQGFLFGRGNQQISSAVIREVGRENVSVLSTTAKLIGLAGEPFLVDTGDPEVDELLSGYVETITGKLERTIYRVAH
jgi:predicted polyphosphate/ATP-dependent NAD kinase